MYVKKIMSACKLFMCYSMITACIFNSAVEIYIEDIFLKLL